MHQAIAQCLLGMAEAIDQPVWRSIHPLQGHRGGEALIQRLLPSRTMPPQQIEVFQRLRPLRLARAEKRLQPCAIFEQVLQKCRAAILFGDALELGLTAEPNQGGLCQTRAQRGCLGDLRDAGFALGRLGQQRAAEFLIERVHPAASQHPRPAIGRRRLAGEGRGWQQLRFHRERARALGLAISGLHLDAQHQRAVGPPFLQVQVHIHGRSARAEAGGRPRF